LSELLGRPFAGDRIVFVEKAGTPTLAARASPPSAALILVGPAGGWEPRETERLDGAGFDAAGLGPPILRPQTAAPAAGGAAPRPTRASAFMAYRLAASSPEYRKSGSGWRMQATYPT